MKKKIVTPLIYSVAFIFIIPFMGSELIKNNETTIEKKRIRKVHPILQLNDKTSYNQLIESDTIPKEPKISEIMQEALNRFDAEFDDIFKWWGEIYDPESGGFYYSLSSKNNEQFKPYIESTTKGTRVLEWTGAFDQTTREFRDGLVRYMKTRQDSATGYFLDPQFNYNVNMRTRALSMALKVLELCGESPDYPLPFERIGENETASKDYAHLESAETMHKWLDGLPWEERSWTVGQKIRSQTVNIEKLQAHQQKIIVDEVLRYVGSKQLENGLLGSTADNWESKLSGVYKITAFFDIFGRDMPKLNRLKKTILHMFYTNTYINLIVLYNTGNIIGIMQKRGAGFSEDEIINIIDRCTNILSNFHAQGGGFVTSLKRNAPYTMGLLMALDVKEGNTNATGLAHKLRYNLHYLAKGIEAPTPHPRVKDFLEKINKPILLKAIENHK